MGNYKYLLIFEDGEMKTTNTVKDDDLQTSDDGDLDIVNMDDRSRYIYGNWVDIDKVEDTE